MMIGDGDRGWNGYARMRMAMAFDIGTEMKIEMGMEIEIKVWMLIGG